MNEKKRPPAFWFMIVFISFNLLFFLAGQTMALFNYDLTVKWGLQESVEKVGQYGVAFNKAVGGADTFIFMPLGIAALVGLIRNRKWALYPVCGFLAVTAYFAALHAFFWDILPGTPTYNYDPPLGLQIMLRVYVAIGITGIACAIKFGEKFYIISED